MSGTPPSIGGWQTMLADLSLILFMICASALTATPPPPAKVHTSLPEPLAIYRADPDAPPLAVWLQDQAGDPRQRLTIIATYAPGGRAAAVAQVEALALTAEAAGFAPRVTVEPGRAAPPIVGLAFEGESEPTPDRRTVPAG